ASTVAVFTYISAKKGLLNTVNTEYHKKVIEKLYALSEELGAECDPFHEGPLSNSGSMDEFLTRLAEQARASKHEILTSRPGERQFGTPATALMAHLLAQAKKFASDPFVPETIRTTVVSYLEGRLSALTAAHEEIAEFFFNRLADSHDWPDLKKSADGLHNMLNTKLYELGFGQSQVDDSANEIRLQIQQYFSEFNPRSTRKNGAQSLRRIERSERGDGKFKPGDKVRVER
ncbi:hypothetical protein, partial [Methylocystis suflitae]|uniref:hypothetical protein n=1 Tax=Methylocystis suflitae TaxID=2951405 RepID=UPI00210EC758